MCVYARARVHMRQSGQLADMGSPLWVTGCQLSLLSLHLCPLNHLTGPAFLTSLWITKHDFMSTATVLRVSLLLPLSSRSREKPLYLLCLSSTVDRR